MWKMANFRRKRKGFALIFVVLIAVAMIIPVMILASNAVSRRKVVTGEAVSDRSLTVADATVDRMLNKINTFPQVNVSGVPSENDVQAAIIAMWEGMLNGYTADSYNTGNKNNVSVYFYNASSETWYTIWDGTNDHFLNVPYGTKLGREITTDSDVSNSVLEMPVKNLNTEIFENKSIAQIDPDCRKDNIWFEVDINSRYDEEPTDEWTITATSYMLSKPNITRTIQTEAKKTVEIKISGGYNWFTKVSRTSFFSDYVFLDNFGVNFGKYSTTTGLIWANGRINMGGWATYPVYSSEYITDKAVDDSYRHDGRFGPNQNSLRWAKRNGYAFDDQDPINWLNVDRALTGTNPVRNPASDTGLQDKADKDGGYYVDRDAVILFNDDGTVTITPTPAGEDAYTVPMPSNGIIYVKGNVKVSGTVKGRCTVGSSGTIYLGGNIIYDTPPRTNEDDPAQENPDFLGLVAKENILIPYNTYLNNRHLEIDAAMVAGQCFGINPYDWQWHYLSTNPDDPNTPPPSTLVVKGSIAAGDGTWMPVFIRSSWWGDYRIKGYDIRQYNFDWNLKQVGTPDGFPTTGSESTSIETLVNNNESGMIKYGVVNSHEEYVNLINHLTDPKVHPENPPKNKPEDKPITINGRQFYAKKTVSETTGTVWSGTGLVKNGLYRIAWKEQIANPVKPEP